MHCNAFDVFIFFQSLITDCHEAHQHTRTLFCILLTRTCTQQIFYGDVAAAAAAARAARDACGRAWRSEASEQRDRVRRAWYSWELVWKKLNSPFDYSADDKSYQEVWNERAEEVEVLAHEYLKGWVASVGATQGLYLHILMKHIPEEIRKWGDLRVRSSQGLEHCHKRRKRIGCEATNRRKGQRIEQMLTHITVISHVHSMLGEDQYATEHEKRKKAKIRHLQAKLERLTKKYAAL